MATDCNRNLLVVYQQCSLSREEYIKKPARAKEDSVEQQGGKRLVWQETFTIDQLSRQHSALLDEYDLLYECGCREVRECCWKSIMREFFSTSDRRNAEDTVGVFIEQAIRDALTAEPQGGFGRKMLEDYIKTAEPYVRPIVFGIELMEDRTVRTPILLTDVLIKQTSGLRYWTGDDKELLVVERFLEEEIDQKTDFFRTDEIVWIRRMFKCIYVLRSIILAKKFRAYITNKRVKAKLIGEKKSPLEIPAWAGMGAEVGAMARALKDWERGQFFS